MYLALITQLVIAQSIPSEMFLLHTLKQGERLKDVASYYHISVEKIVTANKELQNNGYQEGNEIKIPMNDIVSIEIIPDSQNSSGASKANLYTATINDSNKKIEQIWINVAEIRRIAELDPNGSLGFHLELKFSDKEKSILENKKDALNITYCLQRMELSRRNINYAFNKFQFYK